MHSEAQQEPKKVPRIAFLGGFGTFNLDFFRQGLKTRLYRETRYSISSTDCAEGQPDRELELARELAALKVNVIVTGNTWTDQGCQTGNPDHSHCTWWSWRSGRERTCRKSGEARGQCYRAVYPFHGFSWEKAGDNLRRVFLKSHRGPSVQQY